MKTWFDTRLRRTHCSLRKAALGIVAAAMAASLIACGGGKAIKMVKASCFDDYPSKTVGEAFDAFLADPKWEEGVPKDDDLWSRR